MFRCHYEILGICCFLKAILLNMVHIDDNFKDAAIRDYLNSIIYKNAGANGIVFDFMFDPNRRPSSTTSYENVDYSRLITIQFNRTIHYFNLSIYSNNYTPHVWIDILEYFPHGNGINKIGKFDDFIDSYITLELESEPPGFRDMVVHKT